MRLAELIADGPTVTLSGGDAGVDIASIVEDSRRVAPGSLFVARCGTKADGRAFIADAVARGAVALLVDRGTPVPTGPTILRSDDVPLAAAELAERFHGHPSRKLRLVGVTGTNGKTTTAFLVQQQWRAAGERCGLVGTVLIDDGAVSVPAELTTPSAIELSATLARMVANGCTAAAMECSSHALHQRRTSALRFAAAIFTNLTGDHLDYHGSMEAYADAKAMLFAGLDPSAVAVVNADAPLAARMLRDCRARALTCSLRDPGADFFAHVEEILPGSVTARLKAPWGRATLRLPLAGLHNVMNALEAAAAAHALGIPGDVVESALAGASAPPGRLEPVTAPDDAFTILVDYAHTDDALENVLRALRPTVPAGGRLRVVFGCGGDRDRTKRPRMAAVATRYADDVIVTSDNPRTEDPDAIVDEILSGMAPSLRPGCSERPIHEAGAPDDRTDAPRAVAAVGEKRPVAPSPRAGVVVRRIVDRAEAIDAAVSSAREGDVIIVAGKGHEDYQIVGTTKRPFDDRIVARDALRRRVSRIAVVGAGAERER